jgi:hypothetical protein
MYRSSGQIVLEKAIRELACPVLCSAPTRLSKLEQCSLDGALLSQKFCHKLYNHYLCILSVLRHIGLNASTYGKKEYHDITEERKNEELTRARCSCSVSIHRTTSMKKRNLWTLRFGCSGSSLRLSM